MTLLSDAELTAIRADVAQMLPSVGQIMSATATPDGSGYVTETWGTATANVAYRLDPLRGHEPVMGGEVQPFHQFVLTLPYSVTITTAHQFKDTNGNLFAVISVDAEKSWKASTRAVVEKI